MARRFAWMIVDHSISSVYPLSGSLNEAAARQAINDAAMSLCVHITGMSEEYYSSGTYKRDLSGPLVPNDKYDYSKPVLRSIFQRSGGRPYINNWVNDYFIDDSSKGRRAYIIEYVSDTEYLVNPTQSNDSTPPYLNLAGYAIDFYGAYGSTILDLSEVKIYSAPKEGLPWALDWPRGSGNYGKRPPVQFTGSGGTLIYQNYALVPTEEITVQRGWNGELVLGEATGGLDLDNYRYGFGFSSRSWHPSDVSIDADKPPLFWEVVAGIGDISIPGVALLPCGSSGTPTFASCIVVAVVSDSDIADISEFMKSPNWDATKDPDDDNERRIVVFDIFNIAGCYSRVFNKPDYESPVLRLSSDGIGLYNYENLVKNTLVEIPLATLSASGLDLVNTRPLVFARSIRNMGRDDFYMNGFTGGTYGVFLSPGGGASAFWKSLIKMTERL